jgi:tetratricopeptide (TPR) repeat protein
MEARESEASQRLWQPEYLERMIALNFDRDQQADQWHNAAEIFEANVEYPDHLNQAINCYQKAVELLLPGDERRAIFLHHLAAALMGRAESGVAPKSDIKLAIEAHIEAIGLTPEGDPYYAIFVANHGDAMMKLYYETSLSTDFEKGAELFRRALELADDDDPNRENWYTKLRDELYFRSEVTGDVKEVAKALEMHQEDIPYNSQPAGRYQQAILLQKRHLATGSLLDLNEAFSIMDKLSIDCPKDDDHYGMVLNVLGSLFRIRARRLDPKHAIPDCDRSIELQELALKWMEDHQKGTPEARAICLASLACALQRRYHVAEEDESNLAVSETCLDRAIPLFAEAVKLLPNDSPHLGNILGTQANALMARYEKKKFQKDLNLGISTFESALKFQASEFQAESLACLGRVLAFRAKSSNLDSDWEAAIQTYERGAMSVDSPLVYRIMAADDGGNCIFHRDPHRASRLFTLAVKLLPAVSSRSLLRTDQQHNLSIFDGMVWSAVSACLETHDDVYKAIELSETGRGVIGNLQLDVSSDISALEKEYPSHWKRLSEVRQALSSVQANWEDNTSSIANSVDKVRNLNEDFNSLLTEIRELESFGSFLRCPTEDELKDLAETGPVVIFSVSTFRSDALIITQQLLKSIPLESLNMMNSSNMPKSSLRP